MGGVVAPEKSSRLIGLISGHGDRSAGEAGGIGIRHHGVHAHVEAEESRGTWNGAFVSDHGIAVEVENDGRLIRRILGRHDDGSHWRHEYKRILRGGRRDRFIDDEIFLFLFLDDDGVIIGVLAGGEAGSEKIRILIEEGFDLGSARRPDQDAEVGIVEKDVTGSGVNREEGAVVGGGSVGTVAADVVTAEIAVAVEVLDRGGFGAFGGLVEEAFEHDAFAAGEDHHQVVALGNHERGLQGIAVFVLEDNRLAGADGHIGEWR